jgi:hypothetical protein
MKHVETLNSRLLLGLVGGFTLGVLVSMCATGQAQLAPFYAPLEEQLNGIRAEQYLSLERELERAEHDRSASRTPCPR